MPVIVKNKKTFYTFRITPVYIEQRSCLLLKLSLKFKLLDFTYLDNVERRL